MRRTLYLCLVLPLAACVSVTSDQMTAETPPAHSAVLADHENADLATHLVVIPGYTYVDPPADEIEASLAQLHEWEKASDEPDYFTALSFHGVVADDRSENDALTAAGGWELGYLALMSFRDAVTVGLDSDEKYFTWAYDGKTVPERLSIAGTTVFKFEDPDRPYSRYQYMWIRHGVQASFDGADDGAMERWLRLYLARSVLSPNETDQLAQRLVPLAGLAYVNAPELTDFASSIRKAFGPVASSIHMLANRYSSIGSLALVDTSTALSSEQAGAAFVAAVGHAVGPAQADVVDGVSTVVYDLGDDMVLVIWAAGGVVSILAVDASAHPLDIEIDLLRGWRAAGIDTTS
jgi:hypothetical protein